MAVAPREPSAAWLQVQVLTLTGTRIARITAFNDPSLVPTFGLAPTLA
ncbi:hypothetical protein ABZY68_02040 [Streptomyces sp. NPDC006482]